MHAGGMIFWSIVLGVIALLLVLAWRSDRRSRGTGRFRRRKVYDSVRIEESKAQYTAAQTGRWGIFRGYNRL